MGCGGSKAAAPKAQAQEASKEPKGNLVTEGQIEQEKAQSKSTTVVKIDLLSARNLRSAGWAGEAEPYCVVEIVGKPESKRETAVHKDSENPEWNASLQIPGFSPGDRINITVKDKEPLKPDDILGVACLELTEEQLKAGMDEEIKLAKAGEGVEAFLKFKAQTEVPKYAKVEIVGARGLRNADWVGESEPYCIVEIVGKPESKRETMVHKDSKNPEWNATFEIPGFCSGDKLLFTVKDKDTGKDDILGSVGLLEEQLASVFDDELQLAGAGEGAALAMLKLKVQVEEPKTVKIELVSARGLRKADWVGSSEPYCVFEFVGKPETRCETAPHKDSKSPEWTTALEVPGFCSGNRLSITVKDKDALEPDDILGRLEISGEKLKAGIDEEFKLEGAGEGVEAFLKLKIAGTGGVLEAVVEAVKETVGGVLEAIQEKAADLAEAVGGAAAAEETTAEGKEQPEASPPEVDASTAPKGGCFGC